jgi:hypothetical protein
MEPDVIVTDGQTPIPTDTQTQTPPPPPPIEEPTDVTPPPIETTDAAPLLIEPTDGTAPPPPPPVSDPDPIATTGTPTSEVGTDDGDAVVDADDVEGIFDPEYYLAQNPDVAEAIKGTGITALDHFLDFGQFEQRSIGLGFDTNLYLEANLDIKITYEASFSSSVKFSPLGHFLKFGLKEKRTASFFFNAESYLESNPDLGAAAGDEDPTEFAYRHFFQFGKKEQRKFKIGGKFEFDAEFYLKKYESARTAVESGEYASAYDHFQSVGIFQNFTPTPAFDPQLYFDLNEDVASSFKSSGIFGAFFHFLNFGLDEDRDATLPEDEFTTNPTPESDKIVGDAADNVFYALAGDDTVLGYGGDDTITGGEGDDLIFGGDGDDFLVGGAGNDYLNGEDGDDTLLGDAGDDVLEGSSGQDGMWGGAGKDIFSFGSLEEEEEGSGDDSDDDTDEDDTLTGGTDDSGDDDSGDTLTGATTTTTTTSELNISASSSTTTTTSTPEPRDADDDDDDDDGDDGSTDVDTVTGGGSDADAPTDGDDTLGGGDSDDDDDDDDDTLGGGDGSDDSGNDVDLLTGMSTIYDFEVSEDKISVAPVFGFESGDELLDAISDSGVDSDGNLYSILDLSADFSVFIYHDAELLASNFDILGAATDDGSDSGTDSGLGSVDGDGGTTMEDPFEPPSGGAAFLGLPPGLARQIASGKRTEETLPPGISKRF